MLRNVTKRHEMLRNVTKCYETLRNVANRYETSGAVGKRWETLRATRQKSAVQQLYVSATFSWNAIGNFAVRHFCAVVGCLGILGSSPNCSEPPRIFLATSQIPPRCFSISQALFLGGAFPNFLVGSFSEGSPFLAFWFGSFSVRFVKGRMYAYLLVL